ncbi:hypothetical protein BBJ28_00016477 [Nothophytophthora sp. Chile5]|nr:hypothetical protein BBJ28_00016477 [Nothophytophthora sp. Chile5]
MASSVMRFALATFFMKRGGGPMRVSQTFNDVPLSPVSYESIDVRSSPYDDAPEERVEHALSISQDQEDDHEVDATMPTWEEPDEFSGVVWAHISNLNALLVEQHATEFSDGVAELRECVISNGLLLPLLGVLVDIIALEEQEGGQQYAECMTELLLEAVAHCGENKDAKVSLWLKNALDDVAYGLQEYRDQQQHSAA